MSDYITALQQLFASQEGTLTGVTPAQIAATLTVSVLCAAVIYLVYRFFYRGACYSENFAVLLILVTVITAMIILTVSSNLALSLGTIGALSIIRFRSAIKDPLDVGFLFWSVVAGLTTGAGLAMFAVIGSAFLAFVYIFMTLIRTASGAYLLVVHYDPAAEAAVADLLRPLRGKLKSKTRYKEKIEETIQIKVRKKDTSFLETLTAAEGVSHAVLVEFTGE